MQTWIIYSIGFLAQILFSARLIVQWVLSEKVKKIVKKAKILKEKDINDVVSYVRSFEKQQTTAKTKEKLSPIISYESPHSLEETVTILKRAIIGKNFKIIREQYVEQGLVKEGKEDKKQIIIYFCNFNFLNRALAIDPRVGLFLPCRVTVVENKGKVMVMSSNPLYMSRFFNNKDLYKLCKEMYQNYADIIEESTF